MISSVNSSSWRFLKTESLKVLATAASIPFLAKEHVFNLGSFLLENSNFCPSAILPHGTTDFFATYINYPNLVELYGANSNDKIWSYFKGPLLEEMVDRVLLQELLLKRAPKTILKKYSPNHVHVVDHIAVRIARVFTSSVFFALHHSWAHTCRNGDMYPYIMAGMVFGTLQEVSGHPLYSLIAHCATNYLIGNS